MVLQLLGRVERVLTVGDKYTGTLRTLRTLKGMAGNSSVEIVIADNLVKNFKHAITPVPRTVSGFRGVRGMTWRFLNILMV